MQLKTKSLTTSLWDFAIINHLTLRNFTGLLFTLCYFPGFFFSRQSSVKFWGHLPGCFTIIFPLDLSACISALSCNVLVWIMGAAFKGVVWQLSPLTIL